MAAVASAKLVAEVASAARGGSPERRVRVLELGMALFETLYVPAAQCTMRFEPPMPSSARTLKKLETPSRPRRSSDDG
ncbi:hypothetical protein [Bradyrhizobium sp. ARR65]|uniref:hypothetical protein n=1 Tax=Bradyrhizobium sp. ARR65 TaxID=1040989 RepID=UPI00046602F3|nr:hypothetical protein [Bradyrhizobium sp. ARR65]